MPLATPDSEARDAGRGAAPRGLRLPDVILLPAGSDATPAAGIHLVLDHRGVGVTRVTTDLPRILAWDAVRRTTVEDWAGGDDTPAGAVLVVETAGGAYRFLVPRAEAAELGPVVTRLVDGYSGRGETSPRSRFDRVRPVLTVVLIVLVLAAVALILAQSAGAIHLGFLGGNGSGPGGTIVPVP